MLDDLTRTLLQRRLAELEAERVAILGLLQLAELAAQQQQKLQAQAPAADPPPTAETG